MKNEETFASVSDEAPVNFEVHDDQGTCGNKILPRTPSQFPSSFHSLAVSLLETRRARKTLKTGFGPLMPNNAFEDNIFTIYTADAFNTDTT